MYGGNFPPSAHTANVAVTNKFSMPDISITTNFALTLATVHNQGILKYTVVSTTFHIWLSK
jgi:hypothetical protein